MEIMSASGVSTISATDVEVFKRLANPVVVDVQVETRSRKATAEIRQAMEKATEGSAAATTLPSETAPNDDVESLTESVASSQQTTRKSNFQRAQEIAASEATDVLHSHKKPTVESSDKSPKQFCHQQSLSVSEKAASGRSPPLPSFPSNQASVLPTLTKRDGDADGTRASASASSAACSTRQRREMEKEDDQENEETMGKQHEVRKNPPRDSEGARIEKQGYIIELANMSQKGIPISRHFTMQDSVAEMEFEIEKQNNNTTTRQHVVFMRDMMKIGINGLEIANSRFGPFLSIDGWAESVTSDMTKYEPPLEKLYRRYYRRSQMSPVMELAWLLVGSMAAFHFKNKWFQPQHNTHAPPMDHQQRKPRDAQGDAPNNYTPSPNARSRAATSSARSTRPVLRPPSSLFAL